MKLLTLILNLKMEKVTETLKGTTETLINSGKTIVSQTMNLNAKDKISKFDKTSKVCLSQYNIVVWFG